MIAKPPLDAEAARCAIRADVTFTAVQNAIAVANGTVVCRTRRGQTVVIREVRRCTGNGATWVEIWLGGNPEGADPHFRIFNPPQLVEDPQGDITHAGRRFRHDPLAALAEAIADHGGANKRRHGGAVK